MAGRQLKISADTSEIKKSITDLSKTVSRDLGKSKVELFTPETRKFLKDEASKGAQELKSKIDKIKGSIDQQVKSLDKVKAGSKEELKIKEKILSATKKITDLERERSRLSNISTQVGRPGGKMDPDTLSQLGMGVGGAVGRTGILGRTAGLLKRAGPLGLAAAGVAGAGIFGASRIASGFKTFESGVPTRLGLRGRGLSGEDLQVEDPERLSRAGLNSLSLRQRMLTGMDVFGGRGATQQATMQRAEFERGFGLEGGTLGGIGGGLRGTLGGQGANKAVMNLQASLIASGVRDEIGPFLETTASMLTQLNERGFTFDQSALSLFNRLIEKDQNIERMGRVVGNVDQAIRGSTGEANAFFQQAFGGAGIGGGTIGGIQAGIRTGGLFGADLGKFGLLKGTADEAALQQMGIGGETMQKVAKSTVGLLDDMFGEEGEIKRQIKAGGPGADAAAQKQLGRQRFIMRTFGTQNEAEAGEVNQLLRAAAQGETELEGKDIKERLSEIKRGNTDLGNLKDINSSTAGTLDVLKNSKIITEDQIGQRIAPAVETMRDTLLGIDKTILAIMEGLSSIIPGFRTPKEIREAKIQASRHGKQVISKDQIGGELDPKKEMGALLKNKALIKAKLESNDLRPGTHDTEIKTLGTQLKNINASIKILNEAYKEQLKISQKQLEVYFQTSQSSSKTAENTKNIGGIKVGTPD